ncbi:MAG TPA: UDP-glucose--hexose-1-phosphate uridylyltransferase [Bacilli bacterium]
MAVKEIEQLLLYALHHKLLEPLDVYPARNSLLDLFQISEPWDGVGKDSFAAEEAGEAANEHAGETVQEVPQSPTGILEKLLDYAFSVGILQEDTTTHRDLFDARIMGLLMPRQSEIVKQFSRTWKENSIEAATDEFYQLSIASNYIRMDSIKKNQYWIADMLFGPLEITINLSKPEKDPKEIALLKSMPQTNYPKCMLCVENVGYAGRMNHPARQNHRILPLELAGEPWFFQYSPYVYYNEHCIVFHRDHIPMLMSPATFRRLIDFVELFPHYFIGSNADIPIVGGSIINHDHFQGGRHSFPMVYASRSEEFIHSRYPGLKAAILNWPISDIRISSTDKVGLLDLAAEILESWKLYSDATVEILAQSDLNGVMTPHNTITPIARKNALGEYEMDLVLRNNRTSVEHPFGIFHPHMELHHIKKENIGLIEVMGLAVLPGRLKIELEEIVKVLTGEKRYVELMAEIDADQDHLLDKHAVWIEHLVEQYGTGATRLAAEEIIKKEVGIKFQEALSDAGVFKKDAAGMEGFKRFMKHLGFEVS